MFARCSAIYACPYKDVVNPCNLQTKFDAIALRTTLHYHLTQHQRLPEKVESLTDEDLQRPYSHYQPTSDRAEPVIEWVKGSTYEHYEEHTPWIAAIVAGSG